MSVYFEYLQHVYKILSERERIRLDCSRPQKTPGYPTPEQVFYSVANSLNFRTSNRYYNILAYDRTAVAVNAEGYLNANVICDTKGGWWVASQVSLGVVQLRVG
jgi:protein-tyrosine phosphatase